MREIETDYLVVGAGASGMAFVDSLLAGSDADVVMRRPAPSCPAGIGSMPIPFVRLHQPSANYGVNSRKLGNDRIDESGPNAGFYERATAGEIVDYFNRVLEEDFIPSGRVRFFGMCDYRGGDQNGHHFVSLLTGEETTVKVRRKLVDATYVESEIPSRHTPSFEVDDGVRLIPPNDLVDLNEPATGYTIIGAGKTAMDSCNWLMEEGVTPDNIRWIRPRDGWAFARDLSQPLELVGAYMQLQAIWVKAAAEAESSEDFARRMEADGLFMRVDTGIEPEVFRGPILSTAELASLRRIDNVVRMGKVRRIGMDVVTMDHGTIATDGHVFVDCTAAGIRPTVPRPVFELGQITVQLVTIGFVPWSAATIGHVEASREDDTDKNRLCPVVSFTGHISDLAALSYAGMTGLMARGSESDLAAWNEASRLNPAGGAVGHVDDPRVPEAFATIGENIGPAMHNLERLTAASTASAV